MTKDQQVIQVILDLGASQEMLVYPVKGDPGEPGADGREGRDGVDGKDGIGLADAFIDYDASLVLTTTNGLVKRLGVVVGRDGAAGKDGDAGKDGRDGLSIEDLSAGSLTESGR